MVNSHSRFARNIILVENNQFRSSQLTPSAGTLVVSFENRKTENNQNMNVDIERHKLLKILSEHFIDIELGVSKDNVLGIDFENLYILLKCDYKKLKIISSELYTCEEIGFHDAHNTVGLYIKPNGISAYSNNKYKNIFYSKLKNNIKDFVQIVIPVLALMVTVLTILIKIEYINSQTETKLSKIEQRIEKLENKQKILKNASEKNSEIYPLKNK